MTHQTNSDVTNCPGQSLPYKKHIKKNNKIVKKEPKIMKQTIRNIKKTMKQTLKNSNKKQ